MNAWAGGQRPSSDDLELLAERLDLSPEWLLTGKGAPEAGAREPRGAYDTSKRSMVCFQDPSGRVEHRTDRPVMGVVLADDPAVWPAALLEYIYVPELFPELRAGMLTLHTVPGRGWPMPRAWFRRFPDDARFGALWAEHPRGGSVFVVCVLGPGGCGDAVVMTDHGPAIHQAGSDGGMAIGSVAWSGYERPDDEGIAESVKILQSGQDQI